VTQIGLQRGGATTLCSNRGHRFLGFPLGRPVDDRHVGAGATELGRDHRTYSLATGNQRHLSGNVHATPSIGNTTRPQKTKAFFAARNGKVVGSP
jgi:hypothetical protein